MVLAEVSIKIVKEPSHFRLHVVATILVTVVKPVPYPINDPVANLGTILLFR